MNYAEIVLLGAALSADAFAVTVSNCCTYTQERRCRLLLMPVFFGFFQGFMPCLGYVLGGVAAELIETYSGIVTLAILGVIGTNMIVEGVRAIRHSADEAAEEECAREKSGGRLAIGMLFLQAIATAIDAFAVGVSLRAQAVAIIPASTIIACTTAVFCIAAIFIGHRLGSLLGDRAEVVGGAVLVAIGIHAFLA